MNCKEFSNLTPLFLYGEISDERRRAMEAHTASCASCRAALAESSALVSFLERHPPRFSPEDLSALRVRVLSETSRIIPAPRPTVLRGFLSGLLASPVFRFVPVAAAVAVAVWLVLPRATEKAGEIEVAGVLAMADDIERESEEVAEVCREIDDLESSILNPPSDSGAFLSRDGAVSAV
jgi:anti-sigma factor RsiW